MRRTLLQKALNIGLISEKGKFDKLSAEEIELLRTVLSGGVKMSQFLMALELEYTSSTPYIAIYRMTKRGVINGQIVFKDIKSTSK